MAGRRFIHIILNPTAGRRNRRLLDRVVTILRQAEAIVRVEETQYAGHATELARAAAQTGLADVVVAAGGDGTINEVARGLLGQQVPLGVLPLGTANVLAIEIGLALKADAIAETLLNGSADLIGTGLADGSLFLLMVGVGFDGEVLRQIDSRIKRRFGKAAFVLAGLKVWWRGAPGPLDLRIDGRPESASWLLVTNGRHYAGRFVLAPDADISQPGLTAFLFRRGGRLALARYFLALAFGRVARTRGVDVTAFRQIEVAGPPGIGVEVDGDARGETPIRIERGVNYLRLVRPSR